MDMLWKKTKSAFNWNGYSYRHDIAVKVFIDMCNHKSIKYYLEEGFNPNRLAWESENVTWTTRPSSIRTTQTVGYVGGMSIIKPVVYPTTESTRHSTSQMHWFEKREDGNWLYRWQGDGKYPTYNPDKCGTSMYFIACYYGLTTAIREMECWGGDPTIVSRQLKYSVKTYPYVEQASTEEDENI